MMSWGLGFLGLTGLIAHAAQETAHLNIKVGLWEMAMNPQISGDMPSIPEEQLKNATPEERARMQAMMQLMMANARKPRLFKECMTVEKLATGFNTGSEDSTTGCKTTIVKNTGSEFESMQHCSTEQGTGTSSLHVSALSSDQVHGTLHSEMSRPGGKGMTYDATVEGKWLGPDCGTVKDIEQEKTP